MYAASPAGQERSQERVAFISDLSLVTLIRQPNKAVLQIVPPLQVSSSARRPGKPLARPANIDVRQTRFCEAGGWLTHASRPTSQPANQPAS